MSLTSIVQSPIGGRENHAGQPATPPAADNKKLTYCRVLANDPGSASGGENRKAWKMLQKEMALVPAGKIVVPGDPASTSIQSLTENRMRVATKEGFYIDRHAVTNGDFLAFLKAGGYADLNLWPSQVWPMMVQLVDETRTTGPRFWKQGKPPRDQLNFPVTGICWYEAVAYANWVGKKLPDSTQWQRAGTWHVTVDGRSDSGRYPWGNIFERHRANLWCGDNRGTVAVDQHIDGSTPNGVFQLIGNTWEWIESRFVYPDALPDPTGELFEIRGGAFDTYLPSQATCQFRTGQPALVRAHNTGFRCCIPTSEIKNAPLI